MRSHDFVRGAWRPALAAGLLVVLAACGDKITNNNSGPPTFTPDPIVTQADLQTALTSALSSTNGGLDFPMWATVVDRAGVVVAVVHGGTVAHPDNAVDDQWLGSRAISAQKANTANAFSLDFFALSTANLFSAVVSAVCRSARATIGSGVNVGGPTLLLLVILSLHAARSTRGPAARAARQAVRSERRLLMSEVLQ